MKKRILSFLCAVAILMGMVTVPAFAAVDTAAINGAQEYDTLQAAVDAYRSGIITLEQDASAITVAKDVHLDLNGHTVAGVTVTGGTLFVRDAKTDDYTVADGVYGKLTGVSGAVQAADGYLQIAQEGELSFHRVDLKLNGMALRPGNAGVYYTSLFAGDEMVAQQVETFGVALSVSAEPTGKNMDTLCAYSAFTGFVGGKTGNQTANGTLLTGIMKPTNSDGKNTWYAGMNVYGRAYVKTADGYIFGDCVARNLIQQVEAIDTVWASLSAVQKGSLLAMYETYESVMTLWNVPNMKNAFENPGSEEPDGDTVIVLPIPVKISDGKVVEDATITKDGYSVTVPAGVQLATDETELTLVITVKDSSDSGVTLEENQVLLPLDVHVEGVSETNTVPLTIHLGKQLPENLNLGNYGAYHVENGNANEMALIPMDALFTAHNQYKYTLDGEIILHIATFSEIALTADTEAKWEGGVDHSWYTEDSNATEFEIRNADQLWSFSQIVGGMAEDIDQDSFEGKTVKLLSDIDLNDGENANDSNRIFYPIGYYNSEYTYTKTQNAITSSFKSFEGTFDGNGNTISNIYQNTWEMKGDHNWYDATLQYYRDGMGLFGKVYGGTVKNLTVRNFKSDGEIATTGVIAAYADCGAVFENIAIFDCNPRVYNIGNGGIVGCVGWYAKEAVNTPVTFTNITVDQTNKISALWGTYDAACGGLVGQYYPTSGQTGSPKNGGIKFVNCHVAAEMDVNNDVCGNYQYYWYRYCGIFIGSIKSNTSDENGYATANTAGISAEGCTYKIGQWNNYYYCELVANSQASYTHDHQMSRLTVIDSLDKIKSGETWTQAGNFLLIDGDDKTCYHIVKNENEELVQHKHEDSGYDVGIDENKDGKDDLKEDKQIIYLPFNQLMTGDGWGVKAHLEFDGIVLNKDELEISEEKFVPNVSAGYNILSDVVSVAISDLFSEKENVKISYPTVHVYISPVGDDSTVKPACVYVTDGKFDNIANLPISGTGAAKITITDYYFCIPTTISVTITERQAVEKFTANTVGDQNAYTQITLGDLFTAKNGATIGNVTATVTDPNGNETTVTGTSADWTTKTIDLLKDGTWTVVIKDDDAYCATTTATFTVNKVDKFTKKFDKDFLYRVGNLNAVELGYIFDEIETDIKLSSVAVTIEKVAGNVTGTFNSNATWTSGTIRFSGTGVVKVTIAADGANAVELNLEVVDAYNRTSASFSGNSVLLQDVATSGTLSTSGVVYGNGFAVNMENAPISEKNGAVFHLYDGAILKNLTIVGKEFTSVASTVNDTNYGVSAVRAWGTVVIENCYISGCRAAVSVTGTELTIKDSVIANGVYANVDFRSGILNLHNVTTINEPHAVNGSTVVGLGVVGNMTASAGRKLNITGTLTQYNWVSQADCSNIKATGVSSIYNSVFTDSKYSSLRYTYNGTTYVNTGILSLCSDFTVDAVNGCPSGYGGMDVTATITNVTVNGYVWAPGMAGTLTADDMKYHGKVLEPIVGDQGTSYIPSAFAYSNAGLETENGVVQISYESGSTYTMSNATLKSLLTAQKYGQELSYTITMDGKDYTNSDISFSDTASKTYTVVYTITDNCVYGENGELTDTTYTVTKELYIFATVVDKGADAPTFTFYYGTNGSASAGSPHVTQPTNSYASTIKQVGETYYIMPNVSATSANAIGAQTVNGTTVYYPIVDGINVRSGSSTDYDFTRYYPIFKAVKISDNGTEYTYAGTKEMPATVTWVSATIDSGNGASSLNDGFGLYNSQYLCKIQKKAGDAEAGGTSVVMFSYVALDGNTYCYYVGYRFYDEDEGGLCVTSDTRITLADGTQKRVDELTGTEQLLVWNHTMGAMDTAPIAYIVDHEKKIVETEVVHLNFSNGKTVKMIGEHVFFDTTLNKYVAITSVDADAFVGHEFVAYDEVNSGLEKVKLIGIQREIIETGIYEVVSYKHLTCFTEGVLSTSAYLDPLLNTFDIDPETMAYSAEKAAQDIETYGLYTYADFESLISEEAFELYNAAYLKIAVGKGYITWDDVLEMIDIYFNVEVKPIR